MSRSTQEILDSLDIGQSPLTGRVYIGLLNPKNQNEWKCKSDFTERLKAFAPQLFQEKRK